MPIHELLTVAEIYEKLSTNNFDELKRKLLFDIDFVRMLVNTTRVTLAAASDIIMWDIETPTCPGLRVPLLNPVTTIHGKNYEFGFCKQPKKSNTLIPVPFNKSLATFILFAWQQRAAVIAAYGQIIAGENCSDKRKLNITYRVDQLNQEINQLLIAYPQDYPAAFQDDLYETAIRNYPAWAKINERSALQQLYQARCIPDQDFRLAILFAAINIGLCTLRISDWYSNEQRSELYKINLNFFQLACVALLLAVLPQTIANKCEYQKAKKERKAIIEIDLHNQFNDVRKNDQYADLKKSFSAVAKMQEEATLSVQQAALIAPRHEGLFGNTTVKAAGTTAPTSIELRQRIPFLRTHA
jgi:hypothetical protein